MRSTVVQTIIAIINLSLKLLHVFIPESHRFTRVKTCLFMYSKSMILVALYLEHRNRA